VLKFLSKAQLASNQRGLVNYFRDYYIDDESFELKETKEMAVEKLIGPKFDPENDKIDKRILYEVTGRR